MTHQWAAYFQSTSYCTARP